MGDPVWARDPRFATLLGRKEHELELDRLVEEWTVNYTPEEVMSRLQAAGVAAGIVQDEEDIMDRDPHLRYRGYFTEVEHPIMGRFRQMGLPPRLSLTPALTRRAPCLGEHTQYVCTNFLGMSDEEFLDLFQSGVFT
jgi:crotonobetainyl-CoA:carnitine CoA-transferase CaiB-like acyl-CoA transferase